MKNPKFVIHTAADGKPYFTLQAANGQVLVTSETYQSIDNVYNGIVAVVESIFNSSTKDDDNTITLFKEGTTDAEKVKQVKEQIKVDDQTL